MTVRSDEYIVKGKRYQGRALRATRANRGRQSNVLQWAQDNLDPHAFAIKGSSKHRYLMPLDAEMRAKLETMRKPYPKRVRSETGDTPGPPAGKGRLDTDPDALAKPAMAARSRK